MEGARKKGKGSRTAEGTSTQDRVQGLSELGQWLALTSRENYTQQERGTSLGFRGVRGSMCTTVFQAYHTMYLRIYPISVLGIQGWGKPASMEPWRAQPAPTGRVESACCSGSEGEMGCFRGATAESQGTRRGFPLQCMRWHKWKLLAAEVAKGEWVVCAGRAAHLTLTLGSCPVNYRESQT